MTYSYREYYLCKDLDTLDEKRGVVKWFCRGDMWLGEKWVFVSGKEELWRVKEA